MADIQEQELRALVARIAASGELGRSRTYAAILEYLMQCSIAGEAPKETAIAVDVLGRSPDFDVGRDSIVRVHLYHLRNRLASYFRKHGQKEKWRIDIPKGQYLLQLTPTGAASTEPGAEDAGAVDATQPLPQSDTAVAAASPRAWWLPLASALLAALLTVALVMPWQDRSSEADVVSALAPWQALLEGNGPILVVIGDYFIFGELDDTGNIGRLVRDFSINSSQDLDGLYLMEPDNYQRYYNLNLSYTPTGVAAALVHLMPLFEGQQHRLRFRLASELSAADIAANQVLYIGYISGLGLLEELVFAGSSLRPGSTYDELVLASGERLSSNVGLRGHQHDFRDLGLVSTFPTPRGRQVLVIAGTRDSGLMTLAQEVAGESLLRRLADEREAQPGAERAWEALFEITGRDRTGFDVRQVYTGEINTARIWGGEI